MQCKSLKETSEKILTYMYYDDCQLGFEKNNNVVLCLREEVKESGDIKVRGDFALCL